MKHLRKFNESFNIDDKYIISDIKYNYEFITQIDLEDGRTITTGGCGEETSLDVKCKLNIGDTISFEYANEEEHDGVKYLDGVTGVEVNGDLCECSVGSEGGNTETFIIIK